jgi:hypothetical protein
MSRLFSTILVCHSTEVLAKGQGSSTSRLEVWKLLIAAVSRLDRQGSCSVWGACHAFRTFLFSRFCERGE